MLSINLNIGHVVFKYGRDIDLWEGAFGEYNQQARLTAGTVTYDDKLSTDFRHVDGGRCED